MDVVSIVSDYFNVYFPIALLALTLATYFSLGARFLSGQFHLLLLLFSSRLEEYPVVARDQFMSNHFTCPLHSSKALPGGPKTGLSSSHGRGYRAMHQPKLSRGLELTFLAI